MARSLGNLYSPDDFMDEDSDLSVPSFPSPPAAAFSPSLHLPSSPPPPRFGYGYPGFQQEVNNNLNNPLVLRPGMRGTFRPNLRASGPDALTGRHLSRSIPVSGFSDFFSKLLFLWHFLRPNTRILDKSAFLLFCINPLRLYTIYFSQFHHLSCFCASVSFLVLIKYYRLFTFFFHLHKILSFLFSCKSKVKVSPFLSCFYFLLLSNFKLSCAFCV